jgi:tetratricopeptide (TPR) repeat protein
MAATLEDLDKRISDLEKSSRGRAKFFAQYFLSPILVVVIGLVFNYQLEQDRKNIQQIEIAQSMITTLFSEDEFKTLATKRLMDEVIENDDLKSEIGRIVEDYLKSKFEASMASKDFESAKQVYSAAKNIGGDYGKEIVEKIENSEETRESFADFNRYEEAAKHEQEGFQALLREDFRAATESFGKAEEIYPDLHSVSEIHQLLEKNQRDFSKQDVRENIYKDIVNKHSWKVPKETVRSLQGKVQRSRLR